MTVNERLHLSGKLEKFDKAVVQKNVKEVVKILRSVDLKMESIIPILESFGFEIDDFEI